MKKYVYDKSNVLWYEPARRILYSVSLITGRKRKKSYLNMVTAAFTVSERTPQSTLYQSSDKR